MAWISKELLSALLFPGIFLCAAMVPGFLDARLRPDGRPRFEGLNRTLFIYWLPFLSVWILARLALVFVQDPHRYSFVIQTNCRTEACRTEIRDRVASLQQEEFLYVVILAGIALAGMAVVLFLRTRPRPIRQVAAPNPRKWHFSPETGEYYRVIKFYDNRVEFDSTPYTKRSMEYQDKRDGVRSHWRSLLIAFIGLAIIGGLSARRDFIALFGSAWSTLIPNALIAIAVLFAFLLLWHVLAFVRASIAVARYDVGPEPAPPRGREEVEEEMAYGNARPAGVDDIHRALGGGASTTTVGTPRPRTPQFDE